ncbi:MAG: glycerate kinase [Actinobacteria bacterium]|nr:glycerate kinase [Actinomycetota bacterium]MBV8480290.1 glycerate kinase [Actinomycetota bacterium]
MSSPKPLACPASLKGVLSARDATAALARGLGDCDRLPLADGGEGTADVVPGLVEAASVIPFDPAHLDPFTSSRPFGELLAGMDAKQLLIGLGGTANMDAGAGMLEVLDALPPATVLCDVRTTLYDAPRLYGPQKGATPAQVAELEARFRADERLRPFAELPGSGAAGGLGAALASLGATLVPGAATVLDLVGFDPAGYDLVVTGEGRVDATTREGKVPFEVARRCVSAGVRCVVFGGIVVEPVPGVETVALSGDPARAAADLEELGARLLDAAR